MAGLGLWLGCFRVSFKRTISNSHSIASPHRNNECSKREKYFGKEKGETMVAT